MKDAIDNWWKQFERQAPRIDALFSRREAWDLPEWMHQTLGAIHPELMWEFGPAVNCAGHRLVITPESQRHLRPLVREILGRSPSLSGWEFYEYRLAEDIERAAHSVQGRTEGDLLALQVEARLGAHNLIDLNFHVPADWDPQQAFNVAFVGAESLLGEEVLDRWIGAIDVAPTQLDPTQLLPMNDLQRKVEQLIREICAGLPSRPWYTVDLDHGTMWSILEIDPPEADEYPGQSDIYVCSTPIPAIMQNVLSNVLFDSVRHSRVGELFCYLKLDGSAGLEHSAFADRGEIEEALNAALRPQSLGSALGGGTGRQYSYIELALMDVDAAWQVIGSVLAEGRVPKRTWLLFHDAYLATQWRGVYDDTPPPPMPPLE